MSYKPPSSEMGIWVPLFLGTLFSVTLLNRFPENYLSLKIISVGGCIAGGFNMHGSTISQIAAGLMCGVALTCFTALITPVLEEAFVKRSAARAKRTLAGLPILTIEQEMKSLVKKHGRSGPR